MRNQNWAALLIAPLAFLALLLFLGENAIQADPHEYSEYRTGDYARSVAVVWALDSVKDDVSCHDSLSKYQRDFGSLPRDVRGDIVGTYEDLAGFCNDHDPPRAARERAAYYLHGMSVHR